MARHPVARLAGRPTPHDRSLPMDIFGLPLEILEKIFLNLNTQELAACALADHQFSGIVYSSHFLDGYCRHVFNSTVISAADVCTATVAMPFEFWYWVYTTMTVDEDMKLAVVFHSKYLTKIGTLKHMYIMWLMCGMRCRYMYSYALLYELYPLPFTVNDALEMTGRSGGLVNDILIKVFLALPGIMELTCGNCLEHFSMQEGGNTSIQMDIVRNDGIYPSLPIDFSPIFSVEIIASPVFGKSSAVLILIAENIWIMWVGYLNISQDPNNETTIEKTCLSKYFCPTDKIAEIRFHAQNAIQDVVSLVYSLREGMSSPIISYASPDMSSITLSLAQQHHNGLYQKFQHTLDVCSANLSHILIHQTCQGLSGLIERVMGLLDGKTCQNLRITNYVASVLKLETKNMKKLSVEEVIASYILRHLLDRISSLYRNEIHFCMENSFCHTFLCGCIGYSCPVNRSTNVTVEDKVEKCLSDKMKDSMFNPKMWPSHVLSAACHITPALVTILHNDIQTILSKGLKYVIPARKQRNINKYLRNAGLCLTQRPPSKPRCPPLLNQVRLWSVESLK